MLPNVAVEAFRFLPTIVQVKVLPADVVPPTLLVLVAIRSLLVITTTLSAQSLLVSLVSETMLLESIRQMEPVRGLASVTGLAGLAETGIVTVNVALAGIVKPPPPAVQARLTPPVIAQEIVPVVPDVATPTTPNVTPVTDGRPSLRTCCVLPNTAVEVPWFLATIVQVKLPPLLTVPPTLFVLVATRSALVVTTTLSAQSLFDSSVSVMRLLESILQIPPARGLAR